VKDTKFVHIMCFDVVLQNAKHIYTTMLAVAIYIF